MKAVAFPRLSLPADLAGLCLDHFGQEEICLGRLGEGLEALRAALTAARWSELAEILRQVEPHLQERDRLHAARQGLLQAVADRLHVDPAALSLTRLAVSPSLAHGWSALLSRLRVLAKRLDLLTRHVAFLAHHHWDFLQSFLTGLTLGSAQTHCYGRDGQLTASTRGTLLQARG